MTGEERIKAYVERAFRGSSHTEKVRETKEELYADLLEKYREMLAGGCTEEAAYQAAVSSIGDIFEIVDGAGGGSEAGTGLENRSLQIPARVQEMLPFAAAGIMLLFWAGNWFLPAGPGRSRILPALLTGAAAGAFGVWFLLKGREPGNLRKNFGLYRILAVVWAAAGLLFLWSMYQPRMDRALWMIPIAALALNQMLVIWFSYKDSEKGGEAHD